MHLLFLLAHAFLSLSFSDMFVITFGTRLPTLALMEVITIITFWCVQEMTLRLFMVVLPAVLAMLLHTQGRTVTGSVSYAISKGGTQLAPLLCSLGFLSFEGFCKFPFLFDESDE